MWKEEKSCLPNAKVVLATAAAATAFKAAAAQTEVSSN